MLTQNEITVLTKQLPFWEHLSQSQKDLLLSNTNLKHYSKGQPLYYSENECLGVVIVKSGTIRVYITSEEGREITLYRMEIGDTCILSASCVLKTIDFDVSVDAETDCDIIQISPIAFQKVATENVYAELFSYQLATERFSDVMWSMQQILFTSFDKRLATFLLDESIKNNSPVIKMTHEQIAKYLGSAREVVSRMLKYFSKEGYVSLSRGGITILDKTKLRNILSL